MKGFMQSRLAGMAGVTAFVLALPAMAGAQYAPVFDWSVPDRYTEDGIAGVAYPIADNTATRRILNPEASFNGATPAGWPADFTACATPGEYAAFIWSVDGQPIVEGPQCATRIIFPREGQYRVELTVVNTSGARASTTQTVNIQDWLIIGLGDSYGSGEGVPNVPVNLGGLGDFEAVQAAAAEASANYQEAVASVNAAQAAVDRARQDLEAARRDLDALVAAWNRVLIAQQELADANAEVAAAKDALAVATANVAKAVARVAFECAQWWDPAGCSAAKTQLARARQAESAAIARRQKAIADRTAAQAELAQALLAIPVEGFDYARGVLESRVALMQSRLNVALTALDAANQFLADANEVLDAALAVFAQRADGAVAYWQDSTFVGGRIVTNEAPYYEPHRYSQCHQSKFSGQALAALALERSDPKTSVTFVHLACSGGTIPKGILGEYEGIEAPRPGTSATYRPAQLDMAASLTAGREVDALVTSIGGNDVGFAKLIEKCITTEPCFLPEEGLSDDQIASFCDSFNEGQPFGRVRGLVCQSVLSTTRSEHVGSDAQALFFDKLEQLPGKYAQVQARIQTHWPGLPADRMFLTEYPMVSRDQDDNLCAAYSDPANNLPGISAVEFLWAEQVAGTSLNQTIRDQHAALGWTVVTGIADAFRLHGYCSSDGWLVRLGDSLTNQVGLTGTAHPNLAGHTAYAERIGSALRRAFYPQSTETTLGPSRVDQRF